MADHHFLNQDLAWLETCVQQRVNHFLDAEQYPYQEPEAPQLPVQRQDYCGYAALVEQQQLSAAQRKIILIALVPEIKPQIFDPFRVKNTNFDSGFSEFGGRYTNSFCGFLPDVRTALFILAGEEMQQQLALSHLFSNDSQLFANSILRLRHEPDLPLSHHPLQLTEARLTQILSANSATTHHQSFSPDFPARLLQTPLQWSHLVLPSSTQIQLQELMLWLKLRDKWQGDPTMEQPLFKGYRSLFYGPSGTGKTLAVSLLGKQVNRPVYRLETSQLISRYIGETEKNLEKVFDQADRQDWILFFDEADSLFTQRTSVSNSNDRHANQQVAYLLQRVEICTCAVILATNLKENIDPAFNRRFQSIVHFPNPEPEQQTQLWQKLLGNKWHLDSRIDVNQLGKRYDLTGGAINNVIRYAGLMAMDRDSDRIDYDDLLAGIRREYAKQNRTLLEPTASRSNYAYA